MQPIDPLTDSMPDDGRYRLLIEAVTDYAIYMLDPTGIVTSWNPGAQRFKGYAPSEIIGQHFSRFYTEEDRKQGIPALALETASPKGRSARTALASGHTWSSFRSATRQVKSLASPRSRAI